MSTGIYDFVGPFAVGMASAEAPGTANGENGKPIDPLLEIDSWP